jgi:hypothetical protein
MAKKSVPSPFTYPITMRQLEGHMILVVKDFNITIAVPMPEGRFTAEFWGKLNSALGKCWIKTAENIKARVQANTPLPDPSKIAIATQKDTKPGRQTKPLTAPEVSAMLAVSENTVRRIPEELLKFERSKGGHRRYSVGDVLAYKALFASDEEKFPDPMPKPPDLDL